MPRVKGSKQRDLIITYHRPGINIFKGCLMVGMVLAGVMLGYWYGIDHKASFLADSGEKAQEISGLKEEIIRLEGQLHDYQFRVASAEKNAEVEKEAAEDVQSTIRRLEQKVASLEEEVALYKGVMSPSGEDLDIEIRKPEIKAAGREGQFEYKITLSKKSDYKKYVQGLMEVTVRGQLEGGPAVLPLMDISDDVERTEERFRFRYFQDFRGSISLPQGFKPEEVHIVLQTTGNQSSKLEETFAWGS